MAHHLGVLAGLRSEASLLDRMRPFDFPVTIALSASNVDRARAQVRALMASGATHLLSFGYAGGLDPDLPAGTLLLPETIVADERSFRADRDWHHAALALLRALDPVTEAMAGTDQVVASIAEKRRLHGQTAAVAVDMESHIVAQAARDAARPTPFLVLRAICDPASGILPPAATDCVRLDGSVSIAAIFRSLISGPGQIPDLVRLAGFARLADRALLGGCRRGAATGFGMV